MEKTYSASIIIVDAEGNLAYERELSSDETIRELLTRTAAFAYRVKTEEEIDEEMRGHGVEVPKEDPIKRFTRQKPATGKKKSTCGKCGETGHNAKTCGREPEEDPKARSEREDQEHKKKKEAKLDEDARLRVKRLVEGGIDRDGIIDALKRADFKYSDREVEEMIAWAQKDNR